MTLHNSEKFKFDFEDIVLVNEASDVTIKNKIGKILGMSSDSNGVNGYAVYIFDDKICYDILESNLQKVPHSPGK